MDCLRLLNEPWFFAVRGNPEDMLLSALQMYDSAYHHPSSFALNGGSWEQALSPAERQELQEELVPKLLKTPYIRTVQSASGKHSFHVAHAVCVFR